MAGGWTKVRLALAKKDVVLERLAGSLLKAKQFYSRNAIFEPFFMVVADLVVNRRVRSDKFNLHPGVGDLARYLNEFALHFLPVFGIPAVDGNVKRGHSKATRL